MRKVEVELECFTKYMEYLPNILNDTANIWNAMKNLFRCFTPFLTTAGFVLFLPMNYLFMNRI